MKNEIRKIIMDLLENSETHPTAEEIFSVVKERINNVDEVDILQEISNLKEERKIVMVVSVKKDKRERHYESKVFYHHHFICERCGAVRDVFLKPGAAQMIKDHGQSIVNSYAKITTLNLSFQGICHDCLRG